MSIRLVDKCITSAYKSNQNAVYILAILILFLIVIGIIFGVLAIYVEVKWAFFNIFVVPVLGYLIKQFATVTRNNPDILDKAKGALEVAKNQAQITQVIRAEKESEKQRG